MVNLMSANKHVPKIEQTNWVVKERCKDTRHSIPFISLPVMWKINIVLNNVNLLGYLTTMDGIPEDISPRAIMTSETLN